MGIFKSKSLQNIGIYLSASVIAKMLPFIALPIITNRLQPMEYGKWSIFSAILVFVIPSINLYLSHQLIRKYHVSSKQELSILLFNLISINAAITGLIYFLIYIITVINKEFIYFYHLYFVPIVALFLTIKEYFLTILTCEKNAFLHGIFEITSAVILYSLAVFLIIRHNQKWEGLLTGMVFSSAIMGSIALVFLLRKGYIRCKLSSRYIKESFAFGFPLLPHAVSSTIIAMSDRLILGKMLTLEAVGIYTVGYTLGMGAQIVISAFRKAWEPWIHKQLATISKAKKKRIVMLTYGYYAVLPLLWLGVCVAGYFYVRYFIGPQYRGILPVLYWAAGAAGIQGLCVAVVPYMIHLGKTKIFPIATGISAIVNVGLTIYLVRINGMVGAAQATVVALFCMFVIVFGYSQKHYPMPWLAFNKK